MSVRGAGLLLLAVVALSCALAAHIRLIHSGNGKSLYWSDPARIGIAVSALGSDDLPDGSHLQAIQGSIASWNRTTGTAARLVEDESPSTRARTDWAANDLHLVLFDETGASGYFPAGSATLAVTPVWFTQGGRIVDADVLFNGRGFSFTTRGQSGAFDVEDIATHELGHLLGFDHSGNAGSSLYPYVSLGAIAHRSIAADDEHGLRAVYPSGSAGSLTGRVLRASDGTAVAGALVVARTSQGRTVASVLATATGAFTLAGLADEDYVLTATPLEFPVSSANLTPGRSVATDFRSTSFGPFAVAGSAAVPVGDLAVLADVNFTLGRNSDPLPLAAVRGRTSLFGLHGSGLAAGSTLSAADPSLSVAVVTWAGTQVIFRVTVPAGAETGHVDLIATSAAGAQALLPGALEILPAPPVVASIQPSTGSDAGGEFLTITGANFRAGLRLVLGGRVYADGVLGGCSVLDASTVVLTTAPGPDGAHDVVAVDVSGVEGRLVDGFTFTTVPAIQSLFPSAGTSAGGTRVTLTGSGFVAGAAVTIDGVAQSGVTRVDDTRLEFDTAPGVPGGPYVVEVTNPGGSQAAAAFSYAPGPDPSLAFLDPAVAPTSGATWATLHGDGFTPATTVSFGVDALTGDGGTPSASVTFVDAQTLSVLVPSHPRGTVAVMAADGSTGQAQVLEASFTFRDEGGGGGACAALEGAETLGARQALSNSLGWLFALAGALHLARRRRGVRPAASCA
ncbi:MAG: IPT/TIG domain-containing protein [Planctomycetes bacterium]|nr:IPT/TIG domain-containing protein [Planctomycetota bacterium]